VHRLKGGKPTGTISSKASYGGRGATLSGGPRLKRGIKVTRADCAVVCHRKSWPVGQREESLGRSSDRESNEEVNILQNSKAGSASPLGQEQPARRPKMIIGAKK